MDKLEPQKNKKPDFLVDLIISSVILFLFVSVYGYSLVMKSENESYKSNQEAINSLERKYDEISLRFKEPQKILNVKYYGQLELEGDLIISFRYQMKDAFDFEKRDVFAKYAKENLIGEYITVVLPPKYLFTDFSKNMYSDGGEVLPYEYITATVYFNGESLNDKFGFVDPNII